MNEVNAFIQVMLIFVQFSSKLFAKRIGQGLFLLQNFKKKIDKKSALSYVFKGFVSTMRIFL